MSSEFLAFLAEADGHIDGLIGEEIAIVGMIAGDYVSGADPGRPRQTARATFARPSGADLIRGGQQGRSATSARHTASRPEARISQAEVDLLAWIPRRDDIVITEPETELGGDYSDDFSDDFAVGDPEGDGGLRWIISSVVPLDMGGLHLILAEAPRHAAAGGESE